MANNIVENGRQNLKFKPLHEHYTTVALSSILSGAFDARNKNMIRFNWQMKCQYFYLITVIIPSGFIVKTVYLQFVNDNILDAIKQIAILALGNFCIFKICIRIAQMKLIIGFYRRMAKQYEEANHLEKEYQHIMEKSIESNKKIEILWIGQCIAVAVGVTAKPIYEMLASAVATNNVKRQMLFYSYVPFIDDIKMESPIYELLVIYTIFIIMQLSLIYTSFDVMFKVLIVHNCANLDIVMAMLENMFHSEDGSYNPEEINQRMRRIVMLHQQIIE